MEGSAIGKHPSYPAILLSWPEGKEDMTVSQHVHPWGWYPVAFSRELAPGKIITRKFMDADIVIYRTRSKTAHVTRAVCPHLGAHLGGARVDGQLLLCPFHHFAYAPDGTCVRTGSGAPPPRGARLTTIPTSEANGYIFAWHDESRAAPSWEVEPEDLEGFGRGFTSYFTFPGHQLDLLENAVDFGHFPIVHTGAVQEASELVREGPRLISQFVVGGFYRSFLTTKVRVTFIGLGYVITHLEMPALSLSTHGFAGFTPTIDGKKDFRIILHSRIGRADRAHIYRGLATVLGVVVKLASDNQVKSDVEIWRRRTYVDHPKLTRDDAYIMAARSWTEQFFRKSSPDGSAPEGITPSPAEPRAQTSPRMSL